MCSSLSLSNPFCRQHIQQKEESPGRLWKRTTLAGLPFGELRTVKAHFFWEPNLLLADSHRKRHFSINHYNLKTKCFQTPFARSNQTDSQLVEGPDVNFVTHINYYLIHHLEWLNVLSAIPRTSVMETNNSIKVGTEF